MEKILFISNHAGFSKFNKPYIDFLAKNGIKVYNASPGIEVIMNCVQIDIPVSRNPLSFRNFVSFCKLIKLIRNENILNVHCHTPTGGLIGRFLKLAKPQIKVIYTSHGFHFFKGAPFYYWVTFFLVELLLAPLTHAIITINNEDYQISKRFFNKRTYKINGIGIDLNRFKPNSESKKSGRAKLDINDELFVLIYTAQFISRKNHLFLLNAFSKYHQINKNSMLLLLGDGPLEANLKLLVDNLKLSNNVKFLGYQKNIEYFYQLSDVAISVSKQEGLGMNLVEGLASGLTIVASNIRGHKDVISQSPGNYLFDLDENCFIETLCKINPKTLGDDNQIMRNLNSANKFNIQLSLNEMGKVYSKEFNFQFSD